MVRGPDETREIGWLEGWMWYPGKRLLSSRTGSRIKAFNFELQRTSGKAIEPHPATSILKHRTFVTPPAPTDLRLSYGQAKVFSLVQAMLNFRSLSLQWSTCEGRSFGCLSHSSSAGRDATRNTSTARRLNERLACERRRDGDRCAAERRLNRRR